MVAKSVSYFPDKTIRKGIFSTFYDIYHDINGNRWLTYQLFRRDFFSMYKQSMIGIFWYVISPILSVVLFILLNDSGIFSYGAVSVPYPLFAMISLSFWQFFSGGIIASSGSLVAAGPMITKINFSKKSVVISSYGKALFAYTLQLIIIAFLFAYYGIAPSLWIVLIPLFAIPLFLLSIGFGFLLSIFNSMVRDVSSALPILLQFVMFTTPILYMKPTIGILASATDWNPLYYLITFPRDIILTGQSDSLHMYLLSVALSVAIFMVCLYWFHIAETRVTERI